VSQRIAIIVGHPDPKGGHFGNALAEAYAEGARKAGHEVRTIEVAQLALPVLRAAREWESGAVPASVRAAQGTIEWAAHLAIFYPLWLGAMPALLKAFFEQVMRPGFAIRTSGSGASWAGLLKGRSARVVVTMGMPAFIYRWYFRAHSLKSLERNILQFVGISPVRGTLIGSVETCGAERRGKWLGQLRALGASAK